MLSIALFLYFTQCFYQISANSLTVILDSKWENTPLIAETSEFIASESVGLFWNFVEELNIIKDKLDIQNEINNYETVWKVTKKLLNSGQMSVLQLSLAMRTYSPAVEMNHQLDSDLNCENSLTAAKVADQNFCEINTLKNFILNTKGDLSYNTTLYKTDKIYPGLDKLSNLNKGIPVVILYGDLQDKNFYDWHNVIVDLTVAQKTNYVFRHKIKNRSGKTRLSGYGVELAIKSTEYKAVDDSNVSAGSQDDISDLKKSPGVDNLNEKSDEEVQGFIFSKLKELHPNSTQDLDAFKHHLLTSDSEIRPLKTWQIQELSLKAGQFVMNALVNNEALETLRDICQNYPVRAHYLAQVPVTSEFKNELTINQALLEQMYNIQPGQTLVTFNGYVLSQDLDIYEILDLARREMSVMTKLHDFGLQGDHISSLMNVQHSSNEGSSSVSPFLLDFRPAPIVYINNLEKDRRYSSWPKSVNDLLSPTYPGMMRRVAKNFFNAILVLDPAAIESRDYVKFVEAFIIHNAPIRMGFLWAIDPDMPIKNAPGRALVRAFNFVAGEKDDPLIALSFMTDLYSSIEDNEEITVKTVQNFLKSKYPDADMEIVFGEKSDYDDNIQASWKYLHSSGIVALLKPYLLINGLLVDNKALNENGFEEVVVNNILLTTTELQKLVMNHQLVDGISVIDLMMSSDNVVNRLNNKLLENVNPQFISFTKTNDKSNISSDILQSFTPDELSTYVADNIKYFIKNDDISSPKATTIWIIVDLDNDTGRNFFNEALKWVQNSHNTRVGLIQNPTVDNESSFINKAVYNIIKKLPIELSRKAITALLNGPSELSLPQVWENFISENEKIKNILGDVNIADKEYLIKDRLFVKNVLKSKPGESFLITNGKIIGPFEANENLVKDDFKLVERSCAGASKILSRLKELLGGGVLKSKMLSDLTNKIHAVLQKDLIKSSSSAQVGVMSTSKKIEIKGLKEEHSGFSLMGHISKPAFDLVAIIDPLSRPAQKLSHIMMVLKETLNLNVRVIFNCKDKLSEQPLKSFYRFVLDSSPIVRDEAGNPVSLSTSKAHFSRLPGQPLLTLGLEPIHNWLVEPTKSIYDLDNLRFSDVKNGIAHAYFELEYLLLEGHCVDVTTGQPPRGLQFVLSNNDANRTTSDTIVMANLGYFQLKANPGAWNLKLRNGKSRDIYDILDHEYTDSDEKSSDLIAVVNSFKAKIIRVKVNKKPEKLHENLLSESKLDEETGSIWTSISNAFSKSSKSSTNETINIFSVASGHLYERFLRIMMVSVLKQTKSKVKFWFLKNYLSPTFKEFIPHMAKKYGFEYDLVQYKWPRWLHQQTEKQRIIWGYKILFLDVLFPLNISKIIFVDADQMVRADLKELVDLDLEGAPYGYTPFCSSKPEMDGFRFWKSGYWSQHLAGRPYHISALYVVDLNRFRMMAAGDRLRGQYHGLSQDPNSLANLDQDLPNNMIHQVPIKSLPQEWLWCETWCSADEKPKAKTIDLCNNPMTKEPKLSAAMRILPEWKGYDDEIKALWGDVYAAKPKEPYPTYAQTSEKISKDIPPESKSEL